MRTVRSFVGKFVRAMSILETLNERLEEVKINQGRMLAAQLGAQSSSNILDYEFKVFSQWGEDGIIQFLVKNIDISSKTFIEFGVENFYESNCRFLMMKDNWSGFVIDGSARHIQTLRQSYFYWKHELNSLDAFITRDNINELLGRSGFASGIGILSVDLDGNDYYVLERIQDFSPAILICEYNALFGAERKISVPYASDFRRNNRHYSNLYYGCSLAAITYLAERLGYTLVGTNGACSNAFFVKNALMNARLRGESPVDVYRPAKFRESRDSKGNLTHLQPAEQAQLIRGLPVYNVETSQMERF